MANNRMYMKCNSCGETFFLAKSMGEGFYTWSFNVNDFNKFLEKHAYCYGGDEGDFSLEYEEPPQKPVWSENSENT
jgi:hypothetical protein